MASLILDAVVACLLVASIWFSIRLDGRLRLLRADGERMERLIAGLSAASHQAEEAVGDLKDTAGHAGRQLQAAIDKAQGLLTDLEFMADKADTVADRLDASLREQRNASLAAKSATDAKPRRPEAPAADGGKKTDAETAAKMAIELDQTDKEIHNRLASLLKQAEASTRAARTKAAPPPAPPPAPVTAAEPPAEVRPIALQSRAEREFMKALEARK